MRGEGVRKGWISEKKCNQIREIHARSLPLIFGYAAHLPDHQSTMFRLEKRFVPLGQSDRFTCKQSQTN